jgi:hypothetical protein
MNPSSASKVRKSLTSWWLTFFMCQTGKKETYYPGLHWGFSVTSHKTFLEQCTVPKSYVHITFYCLWQEYPFLKVAKLLGLHILLHSYTNTAHEVSLSHFALVKLMLYQVVENVCKLELGTMIPNFPFALLSYRVFQCNQFILQNF